MRTDPLTPMLRPLFALLLSLLLSCAAPRPGTADRPATAKPPSVAEKKEPPTPNDFSDTPPTPAERILLRDPVTGAVAPLSELAGGLPALIDLSASWCEPCAALGERLNGLQPKFDGRIRFFMVLQKGDAPDRLPVRPDYPVYLLERSPEDLRIAPPQILPTVVIFAADGTVAAEMEGLYPGLYYYGVLADVASGN